MISTIIRASLIAPISIIYAFSFHGSEKENVEEKFIVNNKSGRDEEILVASMNSEAFYNVNSGGSSGYAERVSMRRYFNRNDEFSCSSDRCSRQSFCDYTAPQDESCPAFAITTAGYRFDDYDKKPGWSYHIENVRNFPESIFNFKNNSLNSSQPCRLREVGITFNRRYGAFRIEQDMTPVRLNSFKKIILRFSAKIDSGYNLSSGCDSSKTVAVIVDLRFGYSKNLDLKNVNKKFQEGNIVGLRIFGKPEENFLGKRSRNGIFWKKDRKIIYIPELTDLPSGNIIPKMDDEYRNFEIDLKSMNSKLGIPPPGFTSEDAYINGIDIYSSVRGADLGFSVKSIRLTGK